MSAAIHPTPVRFEQPEWADLGVAVAGPGGGRFARGAADEWSLTLRAVGIPHRLVRAGNLWRILVPAHHLEDAAREMRAYLQEQDRAPAPSPEPAPISGAAQTTAAVVGLATVFFVYITGPRPGFGLYPELWERLGAADSRLILDGQWWRAVTALTLHADAAHFLGNAVIGGIFTGFLARALGSGTAWALFVATGFLGNLVNAAFHGPGHLSIGASTAVFGVVGAMGTVNMASRRRLDLLRTVAPVAAGLAVLGMLGSGGERTDLGAHLFGFFAGLPLGWVVGIRTARHGVATPLMNRLLGAAAAGAVLVAWLFAFAHGG